MRDLPVPDVATLELILEWERLNLALRPRPPKRCWTCGMTRWWWRPDGSEQVCGTCHPPDYRRATISRPSRSQEPPRFPA